MGIFGAENIEELENSLVGLKYDKDIVSKYLMEKNIKQYFGDIESSEFIELLFE